MNGSLMGVARHGVVVPLRGQAHGGTGNAGDPTVSLAAAFGARGELKFRNATPYFLRVKGWFGSSTQDSTLYLSTGPRRWTGDIAAGFGLHSRFWAVSKGEHGFPLEWPDADGGVWSGRVIAPGETLVATFKNLSSAACVCRLELICHTLPQMLTGAPEAVPMSGTGLRTFIDRQAAKQTAAPKSTSGDHELARRGGLAFYVPLFSSGFSTAQAVDTLAGFGRVQIPTANDSVGPLDLPLEDVLPRGAHVLVHGLFAVSTGDFSFRTEGGQDRMDPGWTFVSAADHWGAGRIDADGYLDRRPLPVPVELAVGEESLTFFLRDESGAPNDIWLLAAVSGLEGPEYRVHGSRRP